MARRRSLVSNMVAGAIAGTAATWLMDTVTKVVQKLQPPDDAERERAAWPNDQPSVVNLVDLVADRLAIRLDGRSRPTAASVAHYALGAVPGAAYAVLRDRIPAVGAGHGLLYGALLWAVNDEYLNARLGLAAPPAAYPLMTHVRGLTGHLALGVGTDVGIHILGRALARSQESGAA
jgi:uncharacterized membrane protein YagU involved in acid resistance